MDTEIESLFVTLKLNADSLKKGLEEIDKSLKQIGQETEKASREFADMGRQFDGVLRKMRNEFLGFLSVFTAGKSLKNFIEDTIVSSAELDRLSQRLGIAASRLRAYKDANEIAGGSGAGLIDQLKRNADAIAEFQSGLGISDSLRWSMQQGVTLDAFKDAETFLRAQSDVIARLYRQDPNQARVFAQRIGLNEDAFLLLKDGSAALDDYLQNAAKMSGMTDKDAKATEKLRREFTQLQMEFRQTGERIVYALNPAFKEIIAIGRELAQWVNENKDEIVGFFQDGVKWVKDFAQNFREGKYNEQIEDLKKIGEAFGAIGKAIALVVGLFKEWKSITSGAGYELKRWDLTAGNENSLFMDNIGHDDLDDPKNLKARKKYLYYRLKDEGFSDNQVFGIIGSLLGENDTLDPSRRGPGNAYGIAQWEPTRQKDFEKYFGRSIVGSSFEEQVAFKIHELRTSEKRAADLIKQQTTIDSSAVTHRKKYERANPKKARDNVRIAYARQVAREFGKLSYDPTGGISPTALSAQTTNIRNGNVTISGPVTINTKSTDPKGIKREMMNSVSRYSIAPQANTGMI